MSIESRVSSTGRAVRSPRSAAGVATIAITTLLLLLVGAGACRSDAPADATPVQVTIVPNSTAGRLIFRVSGPPVRSFRVVRPAAGRRPAIQQWALLPRGAGAMTTGGSARLSDEVRYGVEPPGFTGTAPERLTPGTYRVEVVTGDARRLSTVDFSVDYVSAELVEH